MSEVSRSRGYLPHWDISGACQFMTWRLFDAITAEEWLRWKQQCRGDANRREIYRMAECRMDEHLGSTLLRPSAVARHVMETLIEQQKVGYVLHAAVIMPNHVHAVLTFQGSMAECMRQIKGVSSFRVNQALGRTGRLWQPESFDRFIRSQRHLERCIEYTHWNPVKAKLCSDPSRYASSTLNPLYAERLRSVDFAD